MFRSHDFTNLVFFCLARRSSLPTMALSKHLRGLVRLCGDPLQLRGLQPVPRALSTCAGGGVEQSQHRGICTNSEGNGPPRVLITGGLGQLGSGLAKQLR